MSDSQSTSSLTSTSTTVSINECMPPRYNPIDFKLFSHRVGVDFAVAFTTAYNKPKFYSDDYKYTKQLRFTDHLRDRTPEECVDRYDSYKGNGVALIISEPFFSTQEGVFVYRHHIKQIVHAIMTELNSDTENEGKKNMCLEYNVLVLASEERHCFIADIIFSYRFRVLHGDGDGCECMPHPPPPRYNHPIDFKLFSENIAGDFATDFIISCMSNSLVVTRVDHCHDMQQLRFTDDLLDRTPDESIPRLNSDTNQGVSLIVRSVFSTTELGQWQYSFQIQQIVNAIMTKLNSHKANANNKKAYVEYNIQIHPAHDEARKCFIAHITFSYCFRVYVD